jgi:hypothetical protein
MLILPESAEFVDVSVDRVGKSKANLNKVDPFD